MEAFCCQLGAAVLHSLASVRTAFTVELNCELKRSHIALPGEPCLTSESRCRPAGFVSRSAPDCPQLSRYDVCDAEPPGHVAAFACSWAAAMARCRRPPLPKGCPIPCVASLASALLYLPTGLLINGEQPGGATAC